MHDKYLNEKSIAALRREAQRTGQDQQLKDTGGVRGLRLRAYPTGAMTWSLVTTRKGSSKVLRIKLGDYGTKAPLMGLAAARAAAQVEKQKTSRGIDPNQERKQEITARDTAMTLSQLLAEYEASPRCRKTRTWGEQKRAIGVTFRNQLPLRLEQVTRAGLQQAANAHAKAAPVAASNAVAYLKSVLNWAERNSLVTEAHLSSLERVEKPAKAVTRDRILDTAEIARILPVLRQPDDHQLHGAFADLVTFLLLTAARRDEAAEMTWGEVVLDDKPLWTVPAVRNKSGRIYRNPLSKQAADLLRRRRLEHIEHEGPIKDGGLIFATHEGGIVHAWDRLKKQLLGRSRTEGWTLHDLRRTARTKLSQLGTPKHVARAVTNHKEPGVDGIYDQWAYLPEKRLAVQMLADEWDRIAGGDMTDAEARWYTVASASAQIIDLENERHRRTGT